MMGCFLVFFSVKRRDWAWSFFGTLDCSQWLQADLLNLSSPYPRTSPYPLFYTT